MRHLFLEGSAGAGKTHTLINTLGNLRLHAGGYIVQRVYAGKELTGYKLSTPADVEGPDLLLPPGATAPGMFFKGANGRWARDDALFLSMLLKMTEPGDRAFLILDETGGYELNYPQYYQRLMGLFGGDVPLIGVIKAVAGYEDMAGRFGLDAEGVNKNRQFREEIAGNKNIHMLNMDTWGTEKAQIAIEAFIEHNGLCNK